MKTLALMLAVAASLPASAEAPRPGFGLDDLSRLADVLEPQFSPDGEAIVYSVSTVNTQGRPLAVRPVARALRRQRSGAADRHRRTSSEWRPQWSPDGRQLAFLSDRGGEEATTQVWIMPAAGGEARKLSDFPGGAEDFVWSPDGLRLAVIAPDPERRPASPSPRTRHRSSPSATSSRTMSRATSERIASTCTCSISPAPRQSCSRPASTTSNCRRGRRTVARSPTSPSAATIPIAT